jgi:hypothetical protein
MTREVKKRIREMIKFLLWVLAVMWFCVFIYKHSGLDVKKPVVVNEVSRYEYVVITSPENNRVKEVIPKEVIYRYVEYR